ncbi:unnamed protein product, partial [Allacma fusca]
SLISEEVVEEGPEVVFTEAVGPDGKAVLIEGKPRVVKKVSRKPKSPEAAVEEQDVPVFLEVLGPEGTPVIVRVKDVKPELLDDDKSKPRLSKKKVKKTRWGSQESPTTHFVEAAMPDGAPVIIEVNESDLTVEEKVVLTIKKKVKKPKVAVLPAEEEEAPENQFIEITGPSGAPIPISVEAAKVVIEVEKKKRSAAKKERKPKDQSEVVQDSVEVELTIDDLPEVLEIPGPDGTPVLISTKELVDVLEEDKREKVEKKQKRRVKGTPKEAPESESETKILEDTPEEFQPDDLIGLRRDDRELELLKRKKKIVVRRKRTKDEETGLVIEEQVVEVTADEILPEDQILEITEVTVELPDQVPAAPKSQPKTKKLVVKRKQQPTESGVTIEELLEVSPEDILPQDEVLDVKEKAPETLKKPKSKKTPRQKVLMRSPHSEDLGPEVYVPSEEEVVFEAEVPEDLSAMPGDVVSYTVEGSSPDGTPLVVQIEEVVEKVILEGDKKRIVKKIKKRLPDVSPEEDSKTHYITAVGPDGAPVIVEVKESDLSVEEKLKIKITKKIKKKAPIDKPDISEVPSDEVAEEIPETQYIEIPGPDGSPLVVQMLDVQDEITEEEKITTKIVKKKKKPTYETEIELEGPTPEFTTEVEQPDEKPESRKKLRRPRGSVKEAPKEFTEIIGPDGAPSLLEVTESFVVEEVGPDGKTILVELKKDEEELTEEEKKVVRKVKKIKKRPQMITEKDLARRPSADVVEQQPEIVYTEATGPDGKPILVEMILDDEQRPKGRRERRIVKKLKKPKIEEDVQLVEEDVSEDLTEEERRITLKKPKKKQKETSPKQPTEAEEVTIEELEDQEELPDQRPKGKKRGSLREFTQIRSEDGTPSFVEVEEVFVVESVGPDGQPMLSQVKPEDLSEAEKRRVKKIKKIASKPRTVSEAELTSIPSEEFSEEVPEIVYTEEVSPEGKPILVKGIPRIVKKRSRKPKKASRVPSEDTPEFLEIIGVDASPIRVEIIDVKQDLTEEDATKPRLSKKKVKKTRSGPKVSPTTHFVEGVGPDGNTVIVEVNASELTEEEQIILAKKRSKRPTSRLSTDTSDQDENIPEEQTDTSLVRPKPRKSLETAYAELIGPDGIPFLVQIEDALVAEAPGPEGTKILVEIPKSEEELHKDVIKLVKKVKKLRRGLEESPKINAADLFVLPSEEIVEETPEVIYTQDIGPSGQPILVEVFTTPGDKRFPRRKRRIIKKIPRRSPLEISTAPEESPETHYVTAITPEGSQIIVEVKESDLTAEEKETIMVVKKTKKKKPSGKSPEKREFLEILGPDGSPVTAQIVEVRDEITEEEKAITKVVKTMKDKPVGVAPATLKGPASDVTEEETKPFDKKKPSQKPEEQPTRVVEVTEITSPDGITSFVEVQEVIVAQAVGPKGQQQLVETKQQDQTEEQKITQKIKVIRKTPRRVSSSEEVFEETPEIVYMEQTGPEGKPVFVEGKPKIVKKLRRPAEVLEEVVDESTPYLQVIGPDGAPIVVEVVNIKTELTDVDKDIPRLSKKKVKKTRAGPKVSPTTHFVEAVGPDGNPVIVEINESELTEEEKCILLPKTKERKPKQITKQIPERDVIEVMGPEGHPIIIDFEVVLEVIETEKRKQADKKKVRKPKEAPEELPTGTVTIEELPDEIEIQSLDGTPVVVKAKDLIPKLEEMTEKRTKKPKKHIKSSEDQEEDELPETLYIAATGPDGTPVVVEVKPNDLTPDERQSVKRLKRKKSQVGEEAVEGELVEAIGPDGTPVLVQVKGAKSKLTEEDLQKPRLTKKKGKKTPWGTPKATPTTHFVEAVGLDGSSVIVEVNETELTEEEKVTLKIKKPKRREEETPVTEYIEVIGPDGIPSLVEITEILDDLSEEDERKRRVVKKQKKVPKGPEKVLKEYTELTAPDGTTSILEVEEVFVIADTGPDGKPILVEIKDLDEIPSEKQVNVTKVKKIKTKPTEAPEDSVVVLPSSVVEEIAEIIYTEEFGPDGHPVLVKGKKRIIKKVKPEVSIEELDFEKETPVYLKVTGPDGSPVTLEVLDVKSELSPEDLTRPRLSKKKVKKTRTGPKESPTTHFVEALGPDGSTVIVEVNENDLKEEEKVVLTIKKKIKKPIPEVTELSEDEDEVTIIEQKPVQPKRKKAPKETQVTEIVGPDGTPQIVEVEDTLVKEVKGPDGTVTLVEVQEEDLTEEEKRKVKRIKKIRKKPQEIGEAELPSISPDEVLEEVPEVVFTEEIGPDGTPVLVEGQPRVVKKIKRKPRRASEVLSEEEEGPVFLEVPGPDGSPIKVEVLEVKPELSVEDLSKPMLSNKKVKRTITGRKESITTHFVDALGPDGTPFIVEVNDSDLKEEEKRILTIKKKVKKPKVPLEQEADEKPERRPKEVPIEFTEVTGPDGQPTIVEVQETLVIEKIGPEGKPVLVEITELEEEDLEEKERRKVRKVKKIPLKPSVSSVALRSVLTDDIIDVTEIVYTETIGTDGTRTLVEGKPMLVRKTSTVPSDELVEEEMRPQFLKVIGPDGTPIELEVLDVKSELSPSDYGKPRLFKKEVKKTRFGVRKEAADKTGTKESPTTHFVTALGPDGTPVIVEVNANDLAEEEQGILTFKKVRKHQPEDDIPEVVMKPTKKPKPVPRDTPVEFIQVTGPDGVPTLVEVEIALVIEDVGQDGRPNLVEITELEEDQLEEEEKRKIKKVRKIRRQPSVSEVALQSILSEDIVEVSDVVYTEVIGPNGKTLLVEGQPKLVKKTTLTPKEVEDNVPVVLEVIGPDGTPVILEVLDVKRKLSEGDYGKPRLLKKQVKKTRFGVRKEAPDRSGTQESPTTHFVEAMGPDGLPVIVEVNADDLQEKEKRILTFKKKVKKPKAAPPVSVEEATPVFLEVKGPDGSPVTVQVLDVKPELTEQDLSKPRLSKKKVKKTRTGPKESPTTHFVEALGPDGSTVIVEVNENDLKE